MIEAKGFGFAVYLFPFIGFEVRLFSKWIAKVRRYTDLDLRSNIWYAGPVWRLGKKVLKPSLAPLGLGFIVEWPVERERFLDPGAAALVLMPFCIRILHEPDWLEQGDEGGGITEEERLEEEEEWDELYADLDDELEEEEEWW